VVVDAQNLTPRPSAVPSQAAGALFVAGSTAYAAVRAVAPAEGDVLAVSGAAGGVGTLAVQLARNAGATVIAKVIVVSPSDTGIRQAREDRPPGCPHAGQAAGSR
jgi:NADPH:quinone reductase-like Zn-dependent oxidoreductase